MKITLWIVIGILLAIAGGAGAASFIRISQIQTGPNPGTTVLTSTNGINAWVAPSASATPNFSDAEVPTGTINGTNVIFTLLHSPAIGSVPIVTINGIVQRTGVDFSVSGSTITFVAISTPQTLDLLQVWYRY